MPFCRHRQVWPGAACVGGWIDSVLDRLCRELIFQAQSLALVMEHCHSLPPPSQPATNRLKRLYSFAQARHGSLHTVSLISFLNVKSRCEDLF